MPSALFIVPTKIDAPGVIDLQLLEGETLDYDTGETVSSEDNQWINQADESMPDGYHTILSSKAIFDDSEPPEITGYRVHAIRTITVPVIRGGNLGTKSEIPRIDTPPDGVVALIGGTTEMLQTTDDRLKAISAIYGIVPGEEIQDD